MKCEACGFTGAGFSPIRVRTTNGGLDLCRQCLDDINRKNPAFEVMTRRRSWMVVCYIPNGMWYTLQYYHKPLRVDAPGQPHLHSDPYTAWVEDGKWYSQNEESFDESKLARGPDSQRPS